MFIDFLDFLQPTQHTLPIAKILIVKNIEMYVDIFFHFWCRIQNYPPDPKCKITLMPNSLTSKFVGNLYSRLGRVQSTKYEILFILGLAKILSVKHCRDFIWDYI